ncbi:hypothetical protein E4J86_26025 [Escherichia coli]|nr:hypothetical protein [Escherichia coli]EAQ3926982.1 hypothetical protein [Salmonella enterica]ECK2428146.1 hypothetical protein [Salmonella enterica subsp. enterica serovar Schwarzengrund]EDT7570146.1 hypothetical protein [Salmonella enterica subsp. enterica serovar Typhimurium var. 5-]EDW2818478.1 hypothetical protein [Salmonella enterica subsp. enterica serovar Typhimurium]
MTSSDIIPPRSSSDLQSALGCRGCALTRRFGVSPPWWRCYKTYPVPSLASLKLSQYTLRYRYVTGSGLRPDTR